MDPPPAVDALLALMQAGDMHALDHLARAYGARLLAVARRRCHSAADAPDAVQQALLAASASMTGFRAEGSALSWLSTLVARSCSRMNRKLSVDCADAPEPCHCEDPASIAERRELAALLGDALMSLSRTDRLAFLLSVEGFNSLEIAERFSLSHDAVRGRLKRARKALRAKIEAVDTLARAASTPLVNPTEGESDERNVSESVAQRE